MNAKLLPSKRREAIRRILTGVSVSKVASDYGISRVLLYRWLKRYKKKGTEGLKPISNGRPAAPKISQTYPDLSVLDRQRIVREVLEQGRKVTEVAKEWEVSRPTIYKWLKRYKAASEENKNKALQDKTPEIKRYFRQTPEKYEEAVLQLVAKHPEYGIRKIVADLPKVGNIPIVGHHGVQNILRRHDLSLYENRLAFAQGQETAVTASIAWVLNAISRFLVLPGEIRTHWIRFLGMILLSTFATIVIFGSTGYWLTARETMQINPFGFFFASLALAIGSFFLLYSFKYYLTIALVLSFSKKAEEKGEHWLWQSEPVNRGSFFSWLFGGNENGAQVGPVSLDSNLKQVTLKRHPFISVHLPTYNEKKVVNRLLTACTSFNYPNYEVLIADDSTDKEAIEIINHWKDHPKVKICHRHNRIGFKGGALREALKMANPRAEIIVVFDADFVPYPDTLELFVKYFKAINNDSEDYKQSQTAAVCGYQWHVLNKNENWITRGVRSEFAGSYVIERPGQELLGAMKLIHGSVYAVRKDVLEKVGWGNSLTEDFELTLKLYELGYKVMYTPYIQVPAECVSTLKRLIRQRMRWAEGHSFNVKKMFSRLLGNPNLTFMEKIEWLYLSPFYLQSFLFLLGTTSWLISEAVFQSQLPFWTELWGWSLVLTNMFALSLLNGVGMFMEEAEPRDYLGLLSFLALSYLLAPFQAYAALKGFLEKKEGPWFRTPKTGRITDVFTRGSFYRFITKILPWSGPEPARVEAETAYSSQTSRYLALATANNQFDEFRIRPRKMRWISKLLVVFLLTFSITVYSMTKGVPEVLANPDYLYMHPGSTTVNTCDGRAMNKTSVASPETSVDAIAYNGSYVPVGTWYFNTQVSQEYTITSGTVTYYWQSNSAVANKSHTIEFTLLERGASCSATDPPNWTGTPLEYTYNVTTMGNHTTSQTSVSNTWDVNSAFGVQIRIRCNTAACDTKTFSFYMDPGHDTQYTGMDIPGTLIPENVVYFALLAPLIPILALRMKKTNLLPRQER